MDFEGAIFDLDGVIVNTVPLHFKAWRRMFAEFGKKFTFDDYKKRVDGIPRIDGARAILGDVPEEILSEACRRKQRYFRRYLDEEKIEVYQSTVELIRQLKAKRVKVAVASSSQNTPYILKAIELDDVFDAQVFGREIKKGKPAPEIFLKAARKLKVNPRHCVVFEDAQLGIEAARAGGMVCVAVDRYGNAQLLKKADVLVRDLNEVNYERLASLFIRRNTAHA